MDIAAAKDALLDLHREFLPQAYRRDDLSAVLSAGEMQRLCDAVLDGALAIEGLQQQVDALRIQRKIFNPLDAEFSLCADPNEQPEPEAPQFK